MNRKRTLNRLRVAENRNRGEKVPKDRSVRAKEISPGRRVAETAGDGATCGE